MAQAKLILSTVAVLATIAGAFALKEKRLCSPLYTIKSFNLNAPTGFQYCTAILDESGTVFDVPMYGANYYYVTETAPSLPNLRNPCSYAYYLFC